MNNTFNIKRFGLLVKRQWLEFGKIYLISLTVALGIIILFYSIILWKLLIGAKTFTGTELNFREPLFSIFGFIFISIIASSYFAHLGQKPKAIIELLIPASIFEKFLKGIFFTSVIAIASFIVMFYITDLAFVSKIRGMYATKEQVMAFLNDGKTVTHLDSFEYFFIRNYESAQFLPLYVIPFFITSIFLLGSIYFNKYHYIKIAISAIVFIGLVAAIIGRSGQLLFEGKVRIGKAEREFFNIPRETVEWLGVLFVVALTTMFWIITYVRLKEKQV